MKFLNQKSNLMFQKHLKLNFPEIKNNNNKEGVILVEFHAWASHHICYPYIIDFFKKKYSCKVSAYEGFTLISSEITQSLFQKLRWKLGQKLGINNFGIYKQMGVQSFIRPEKIKSIDDKVTNFIKSKKVFKNNNDLINFKLNKVWIGDLIYDTYLKIKNIPTINVNDKNFQKFFLDAVYVFFYWFDFFNRNKVNALIISHSTYLYGMIMRIANSFSITVCKPTFNTIYKIKKKNYTIGEEFFSFKKKFDKLPIQVKKAGILKSKKEIDMMILGKRKFGLGYNFKKKEFNKKRSKSIKVMIAMHNFYDSPHVFGKMLFPDFLIWLKHIVNISLKTDYEWYLKIHPENTKKDYSHIQSIIQKNKNIKIISHKKNQNEIVKMRIRYVLTCFGSIGFEYAYRGITVINACVRNPHAGYNFTLNPRSIKEFNKIILNLKKYKLKPVKKEILEFFFMRRFYLRCNWLFINRNQISDGFGWKKKIYRPEMYRLWVNSFNKRKHEAIIKTFENFMQSNSNKLEKHHLAKY